jgi:hypothetical protein
LWRIVWLLGRGECGADLVGFGDAELGEQGQCLVPVVAGLVRLADGVVGVGEAVVGAGLLIRVADVAGEGQGGGVRGGGLVGFAAGVQGSPRPLSAAAWPARSPISRYRVRACWWWSVACG